MSDANKYTERLAGHYVDLERFVQAIYESTQPFAELKSAAEALPLEFDIDTAVGVQLDARRGAGGRQPQAENAS